MTKLSIPTLVLLCAMAVPCTATDYKGTAPDDGATCRLYNVGADKFLSSTDGTLTLGGSPLTVTLTKTADGYYTLSTADGNISATLWGSPRSDGSGKYMQWKFTKVTGTDDVYTLANRNREASATFSIYQDTATGALALEAAQPGTQFTPAQWKLVGEIDPPTVIETIDEAAETDATGKADAATHDMFNTAGQKVKANATGKENMPRGIYIINGKKLIK